MAKIYYDSEIGLDSLQDLTLGLIGYGNQGRAHALNLRDSGFTVAVGAREDGAAYRAAVIDGFNPQSIETVSASCDLLALMLPDEHMHDVYVNSIEPYINADKVFVFAHGFAVQYQTMVLPEYSDVVLVAPTGPGKQLRSLYEQGKGLPALVAVGQDGSGLALPRCLAYGKAIGSARAGLIETTFAEETVTDLFCEQAVLCGGIPELIKRSFATLTEAGYQPELAYISCLKEVKLIADLLFEHGIDGMRSAISTTAQFGSVLTGPELVNDATSHGLSKALKRIESGAFAKQFLSEAQAGSPTIKALLKHERLSQLARTGRRLRDDLNF
jgi:ketol-acid reductoisomerase